MKALVHLVDQRGLRQVLLLVQCLVTLVIDKTMCETMIVSTYKRKSHCQCAGSTPTHSSTVIDLRGPNHTVDLTEEDDVEILEARDAGGTTPCQIASLAWQIHALASHVSELLICKPTMVPDLRSILQHMPQ